MKILGIIKKTLASACVCFTFAEFLILAAAELLSLTTTTAGGGVRMFLSFSSTALVFLTCLMFSVLNLIWRLDCSLSLRAVFHFLGSLALWCVIFIIVPGVYTDSAQMVARLFVFAVLYAVVGLIALAVYLIKKHFRSERSDYAPVFKNGGER